MAHFNRSIARSLGVALLVSVGACNREPEAKSETRPEPEPAPSAHVKTTSEVEARAVFDTWLAAQNAGDFATYASLYAERFSGVKRVGERSERFDREGWLRDRQRMFKKPMQVGASDSSITVSSSGAGVRFVQSFRSGTFEDRGTKELRLVRTDGGLRIASEELFESRIAARNSVVADVRDAELRQVVHARESYVVLGRAPSDLAAHAVGELELASDVKSPIAVRKAVRADALREALRKAPGTQVRLYDDKGVVCRATLGKLSLLRRVTPHFGAVQTWAGQGESEDQPGPVPLTQIAQEAWDEAGEDSTLLVASLSEMIGDCKRALWARDETLAEPTLFVPGEPTDAERQALMNAVRKLPAYKKIARGYAAIRKADPKAPEHWENHEGASPTFVAFRDAQGKTYLSFQTTAGACNDFVGTLWALYAQRGAELVLVNRPGSDDEPSEFSVQAMVDADGDGLPEVLGSGFTSVRGESNVLLRGTQTGLRITRDLSPPYHDCPC